MSFWFFLKYTVKKIFTGTGSDFTDLFVNLYHWVTKPSSLMVICVAGIAWFFWIGKWKSGLLFVPLVVLAFFVKEWFGGEWKGAERKMEEEIIKKL